MAGEQSIANSAQDVRIKIGEFAAKLKDIHDELSGRIGDLETSTAGLWIGDTPPLDLIGYSGWVNTSGTSLDFLYNSGTVEVPTWTSILSKIHRPSTLGVPYRTLETVDNRDVWAVDLTIGNLPNSTTKLVQVPTSISSTWEALPYRWLDTSNSWAYDDSSGVMIPLPHVTTYVRETGWFQDGNTRSIILYLEGNNVVVQTESNRTNLTGVVRLKYLKAL